MVRRLHIKHNPKRLQHLNDIDEEYYRYPSVSSFQLSSQILEILRGIRRLVVNVDVFILDFYTIL